MSYAISFGKIINTDLRLDDNPASDESSYLLDKSALSDLSEALENARSAQATVGNEEDDD